MRTIKLLQAAYWPLLWTYLILYLLLGGQPAYSATSVIVVGPSDNQASQTFVNSLQTLAPSEWEIHFSPEEYPSSAAANQDTVLICLGEPALIKSCRQLPNRLTVALFVTREQWQQHAGTNPDLKLTGIYLDAPLERQVRLAELVLPRATTAGILSSKPLGFTYTKIANHNIKVFALSNYDSLSKMLNEALAHSDYLLGIPDWQIYNGQEIRQILLTAYRRNQVLIGPSLAFVNAGGLATTYSTTADYARQSVEMIQRSLDQNNIPSPEFAHYFAVAVNLQVAKSLNLIVLEAKDLQSRLQMLEVRP